MGMLESGKGHIGEGANADIAIYPINPSEIDPSRDYKKVENAFAKTAYTIKSGAIVARDGEITATPDGRTIFVEPQVDEKLFDDMYSDLEELFRRYYSVNIANYPLQDDYIPNPYVVPSGAKV
jgi:formylmethanofuran dehydrogenase subunit A